MKKLLAAERYFLIGHILSMAFGLAGLLLVVPNVDFLTNLPEFGQTAFRWSMAGGGVVYMLLATVAVSLYAYRTLGLWHWLTFMLPAIFLSLSSELLGTSTGFPFGHYHYLDGLGYKIAGLVPFTIPLSWFYLGFSAYLIVRTGLESRKVPSWISSLGAIVIGALILTSWDFVLDPAMSQTAIPFWMWEKPGAFFGMPYQNFAGWMGTGVVFMSVATLLWRKSEVVLPQTQLGLPLAIYLGNFAFAMVMSIAGGIYPPIFLGLILGVAPAIFFYWLASSSSLAKSKEQLEKLAQTEITDPISLPSVEILRK